MSGKIVEFESTTENVIKLKKLPGKTVQNEKIA